jgi:iron complex transport system substrate-binding protein
MKTKIVVLVGIALCTMLLISPALASNVETLDIYGNANEDDTIDMRDLTYVKLIFFGKKPETELADAKYDGKINPLDFIQIKLIIVGKEKELTLIDSLDRIVTVKKPVQRVFTLADVEVFEVIKGQDKIVGVYTQILTDLMFPGWSEMPATGYHEPDYILNVNPDLVVAWTSKAATHDEKLPDSITVLALDLYKAGTLIEEMDKLGYILDKKDESEHYINDFHDKYIDLIEARTEKLSEKEKTKVYLERKGTTAYKTYGSTSPRHWLIDKAGGENIFGDIEQRKFVVDPEEVVRRNPDIIIKTIKPMDVGYDEDIFKVEAARARDEMMNRPELANVNAVKNEMVYVFDYELMVGSTYPIAIAYWAKLFYPDLFEDLDPQAIYQEYLTEYKGVDLDLLPFDIDDEIWIYQPLE